jgi:hypothetical protein
MIGVLLTRRSHNFLFHVDANLSVPHSLSTAGPVFLWFFSFHMMKHETGMLINCTCAHLRLIICCVAL